MILSTKFDRGQTVYYIANGQIAQSTITQIFVSVDSEGNINASYTVCRTTGVETSLKEAVLFETKKEVAQDWLVKAGLEPGLVDV